MTDSPLSAAAIALIAGNFVGAMIDRISAVIEERVRMIDALNLDKSSASILDSVLGIFLQAGLLTLGTKIITNAFPWLTEDPASFILYARGLSATSIHLDRHMRLINTVLFDEGIYKSAIAKKERDSDKAASTSSKKPQDTS